MMPQPELEPLQTSAVDEGQLAYAGRKVKDLARAQLARWRHQLSSYEGREFLWTELFGELRLFDHIEPSDVQGLGLHNLGVKWWAFVQQHPDLFLQMQNEAIARGKKEREERRAMRTSRAVTT